MPSDNIAIDVELPNDEDMQLDNLVYQACEGDISKKDYIESTFSKLELINWFFYRRFNSYAEHQITTKLQNKK